MSLYYFHTRTGIKIINVFQIVIWNDIICVKYQSHIIIIANSRHSRIQSLRLGAVLKMYFHQTEWEAQKEMH